MKLVFSIQAQSDLIDIALFIAEDSPVRAFTFTNKLEAKAASLREVPYKGADRSDLQLGLRLLPYGNYNIYYRINSTDLEILRIMHAARNLSVEDLG